MGQGGDVTLVNETTRNWRRVAEGYGSYQMNAWNFPEEIRAGQSAKVYVEWDEGLFTTRADDSGNVRYLLDGTATGFELQARATSRLVNLQVLPIGMAQTRVVPLGWRHDGNVELVVYNRDGVPRVTTKHAWRDVPLADWMARLDGALRLSELTIPGTHNSCATGNTCSGFSRTQTMSLTEQLNGGIRFLDVRCRHVGDRFAIHHGREFLGQWFPEVLDVCLAFLDGHPGETLIMSVKREHDDADNKRSYADVFDSCIRESRAHWYLGNAIPKLDDVRGKIVLFRRFPSAAPLGIAATAWPNNTTFDHTEAGVTVRIQDRYEMPFSPLTFAGTDLDAKWALVKEHLDKAIAGKGADWYLNYTTGANVPLVVPRAVAIGGPPFADGVNAKLLAHLRNASRQGRYGTVVMDFPESGRGLLAELVSLNRR